MVRESANPNSAVLLYRAASVLAPTWSAPRYNLGLRAKYQGRWQESLNYNQQAVLLDPDDEAGWWNLAIAATALRDWNEAQRAWSALGIHTFKEDDELRTPEIKACVRLDPDGRGEVVWGLRLDPARIVLLSLPLPESHHRFHDIVLNDGAQEGTRRNGDVEVPVFNELQVWQRSAYSTYEVDLTVPDKKGQEALVDICDKLEVGLEDWSTIRFICAECSRGSPKPHECRSDRPAGEAKYGFSAKKQSDLQHALETWSGTVAGAEFGNIELRLDASQL